MTSEVADTTRYVEIVARECAHIDAEQDRYFTIHSVHDRLHALSKDQPDDAVLRALAVACGYRMEPEALDGPYVCGPFGPMWVMPQENGVSMVSWAAGSSRGRCARSVGCVRQ